MQISFVEILAEKREGEMTAIRPGQPRVDAQALVPDARET